MDACVLYPAPLRDLLIELAATDLYRAKWSDRIHNEWTSNLLKNRPDITAKKLHAVRKLMDSAVMDCLVTGFEQIEEALSLPDINDRHVLAAAIAGKADAIVTFNIKDFPASIANQYDLEILHPDDFLKFQFDFDQAIIVHVARSCRARLKNPPINSAEYLAILERQGLPKIVTELKRYEAML